MRQIIFETERIYISRFTSEEENLFYAVNGDEEVMHYIRPAKSVEECRQFLKQTILGYEISPNTGRWAMHTRKDDRFIGLFAVIPLPNRDELQIGYAFLKDAWGKGYATEALKGGVKYCFEVLNLPRIKAITSTQNTASQKVLLKAGFSEPDMLLEYEKGVDLYELQNPKYRS